MNLSEVTCRHMSFSDHAYTISIVLPISNALILFENHLPETK